MLYEEIDKTSREAESKKKESNIGRDKNDMVDNIENDTSDKKRENHYQGEHVISLKNVNAKWFSYDQEDTLKNMNIHVKRGELVAVVGHVGSGKSSLLNVLLKELPVNSGTLEVEHLSVVSWLIILSRIINNKL